MKNTLIILSLLITLGHTNSAKAQKAYDIINYKSIIYGCQATLKITDGYLLASKIIIRSKFGNQVFTPAANEPDGRGDFRLDAVTTERYKENTGSWFTLKGLNMQVYPLKIKAVYWDGKVQKTVIFRKE